MSPSEIVDPTNEAATMSSDQITQAARRMMRQIQHDARVSFYDHWLNKLGLAPVIQRLDDARNAERK